MKFDVLVIGAGHAGIEAALASARMGRVTCLLTSNMDRIGHMSCNPAIGGVGKGHIVKEVDALGGEMGRAIDDTGIQFRRLNTTKGPAVRATRAQADKYLYNKRMKQKVENTKLLHVKQSMAEKLLIENGQCTGAVTGLGEEIRAGAVVVTTGTFLNGLIHIGQYTEPAGRHGDQPSVGLSASLLNLGLRMGRLKTGTVPRLDVNTIDFSELEEQKGDTPTPMFSFYQTPTLQKQISCFITFTNEKTHEVIKNNLHESAMYSGNIKGVGPRYCPSIEDKVVRFADKDRHQIFLEPEGLTTSEIYPNGLSNSLPFKVQIEFLRTMKGLENVEVTRAGYAIEYDYVDPTELHPSLQTKKIPGLFLGGQINGTTGYEEAAGQGLLAGINAALFCSNEDPLILKRSESYIGVMVDDLVTKGTKEPYRMFTSRAEHRLHLREDNADERMFEIANKFRLLQSEDRIKTEVKLAKTKEALNLLNKEWITPSQKTNAILGFMQTAPIAKKTTLKELLRRPEISWSNIEELFPQFKDIDSVVKEKAEISIKYEGYIDREMIEVRRANKEEEDKIPNDFNYLDVPSLSNEVREKLLHVKPLTLGQASRISGVTPAAIGILSVFIKKHKEKSSSL